MCPAWTLSAGYVSLLLGSVPALAGTIFADWQSSGLPDGTAAHPYRTLPQALAAAAPGDTIAIRTGCYSFEGGMFNKSVTVRADNGRVTITNSGLIACDGGGPNPSLSIIARGNTGNTKSFAPNT